MSKTVVPYVGTWIEIAVTSETADQLFVVPYVGTWIEIIDLIITGQFLASFPTWERG